MQISICRNIDIRMQGNGINGTKLEKVREESFSFKRRVICNWKLLKESLTPVEIIDHFISQELVASDLWDYIKNKSRRYQMDSILTSVVKNIETSDDYDKFETIATTYKIQLKTPRDELFIPEQRRLIDRTLFRENRELVEKELYPKDHIDSFLEWFILSPEDHEALRNKENVRKQMANSFLQKIMKPISIEKGSMTCLLESFQKDQNRILMHLVKLMDAGISYFIGDQELQSLIEKRDACRNTIMSKWTYLKENFYPHKNLIDELCSSGLIDDDRAESINEQPRGQQVYWILRNIVRRIDGPEKFSKFISLLEKESSFISEKLGETSHKSVRSSFSGDKYCFCRKPYKLEDKAFRDKLHQLFNVYKDDIARELYPTDVDTFMDKLVFDVDDHEIICEAGNDESKKAWKFYEMIADTKYIQKGSFDCLIFCLRNNEKLKKSRQILADMLFSIITPKQGHFTEGELKLTVDDLSKDELEHEIFKVVKSSEYQGKEIDGLKLNVQEAKRSSVVVHLQSNGENVKLVVEKGIVEGDLSSFIMNLLDDENIKMHMIQGHKYKVSVSLHSKNQHNLFSGVQGSHKMRIIKANRELLEEEYDPLPLLKSVFDENVKKYKSVTDLSPQYVTAVFNQFKGISEVPERRKRVKQFMDIAEYMIDADTLWKLIEDTANAFSVKKLRDDLHGVNSGQENIKSSAAYLEDGLVFKGSYEVWITEEDVFSPLQSMILETNQKQDNKSELQSMILETNQKQDKNSELQSMILVTNQKQEEEIKHMEDVSTLFESMHLETRRAKEIHNTQEKMSAWRRLSTDAKLQRFRERRRQYHPLKYQYDYLEECPAKEELHLRIDVDLWIKIRNETLVWFGELIDQLREPNKKSRNSKAMAYGIALVGGAFALCTGSIAVALVVAAITVWTVVGTFNIDTYGKQDILNKTQQCINKDMEATHQLKAQMIGRKLKIYSPLADKSKIYSPLADKSKIYSPLADKSKIYSPLTDDLQRIKLDAIVDLPKDPLKAVDKLNELRLLLVQELEEVERIQEQHRL